MEIKIEFNKNGTTTDAMGKRNIGGVAYPQYHITCDSMETDNDLVRLKRLIKYIEGENDKNEHFTNP